MAAGHTITIDGLLGDWLSGDRIDDASVAGYRVNATSDATYFYFSLTAPAAIGANTTAWLNTDRNAATGYQIFGFAGGAEYNVNFAADDTVSLFSGAAGGTLVAGGLTAAWSADRTSVEFRIPKAAIGNPNAIDTLYDINDIDHLPTSYSSKPFVLFNDTGIVPSADKRVGIVYSDTTANAYFSKSAYSQLFMAAQSQAMQAGIPFDILTESDLTNLATLAKYDVLVFPSFRNVQASQVNAITNTLEQAVHDFGLGLVVGGEFMVVDAAGFALPGDSYARMKLLLDVTRVTGGTGNLTVTATSQASQVLPNYYDGQVVETYTNSGWNTFTSVSGTGVVLANETINGSSVYPAVISTLTGGRNVHFATEGIMADANMLQSAINYAVTGNTLSAGLQMTRLYAIVATRVDMDQSQESFEVNPDDGSPGIYDLFVPTITSWKQNYNFVGSYYVNIGNSAPDQTTDWAVSLPYYKALIDLGGEIGSHSYTHPENTNVLTASQIQFEFGNSQTELEQQLSAYLGRTYNLTGAALPGMPETLATAQAVLPYVDQYLSGGYSGEGAGYPNAFGYLTPQQQNKVYLAPNATFDFTLMQWLGLSVAAAEAYWAAEWDDIASYADAPVFVWPIHDYGVAAWDSSGTSPYQTSMFTNWVQRAYEEGAEFVTLTDLAARIAAMKSATLTTSVSGNTITANVGASNVGTFALDIDGQGSLVVKNVAGWYAYSAHSVYLPASGGNFTITMGPAQDDVTHITDLPMRASLITVSGDGRNLAFSVNGEGQVVIDLQAPGASTIQVSGASIVSQVGEILTLDLGTNGTHNVTVTFVTVPPNTTITSNGGGDLAALSLAENGLAVATVIATPGVSGATVQYSIVAGGDGALFAINANTGALTFIGAPNFESPTDAGANNIYDVTVRATDGTTSDTQAIAVTITNVNEAPVITSNGGGNNAAVSVAENGTAVLTVASTDPENVARTYSISGGADAARFSINATTGALAFLVAPNFEAPVDSGANNVYNVSVRASDGVLNDTQAIAITVTNVAEAVDITSNGGGATASVNIAENGSAVTTVIAVATGTVAYTIAAGGDGALFAINPTTGALTFAASPDFEAPADSDLNNSYLVTVVASDGTGSQDTQLLTVNVTNVAGLRLTAPVAGGTLNGSVEDDTLNGRAGNDILNGLAGNDTLSGAGGNDTMNGGAGNDRFTGGAGTDSMTGGAGIDTFVFTANGQSSTSATLRDIITDFETGTDFIDLSGIDANNSTSGNQAFAFIGTAAFTALGQVRYAYETVGGVQYTVIQTNSAGGLGADFSVALEGNLVLAANSFVL